MRRMGVDPEDVKRSIDEVVLKTLICADDQIPFQVSRGIVIDPSSVTHLS